MANNSIIQKDSIHRLISDIRYIRKNSLHSEGIYYMHDDEEMLKGYVMIIGPSDTPYENGLFFFDVTFPHNYPHSPPSFTYLTNDGKTRFNPNLYRSGKVCLSILNTWHGEQWTSCQTLSSVLLTLVTIFNDNPLMNEPGITDTSKEIPDYNKIISYKKYETSIYNLVLRYNTDRLKTCEECFRDEIVAHIKQNKKHMLESITKMRGDYDIESVSTNMYQMKMQLDYNNLYTKIKNIKIKN